MHGTLFSFHGNRLIGRLFARKPLRADRKDGQEFVDTYGKYSNLTRTIIHS